VEPSAIYDRLHQSTYESAAYREALRASENGLPDWVVPFSIVDAQVLEVFAQTLRIGKGDTLVDLGCGTGGVGLWVAERTSASLVGIDFSPVAIDYATALAERRKMSKRARFQVAPATATGLPQASATGLISIDMVMFVDARDVAAEIARVLEPGGVFAMTAAESLVEPFLPTLVRDYRPIFEEAGFTTLLHEEQPSRNGRRLAFYRALDERAEALQAELGESAEMLLAEARDVLARAGDGVTRVRDMIYVGRRRGSAFAKFFGDTAPPAAEAPKPKEVEIVLRPATGGDREFIENVYFETQRWIIEQLFGWRGRDVEREKFAETYDESSALIVACNGTACGWMSVALKTDVLELTGIYLLPEYQRRGIGTQLIQNLIGEAARVNVGLTLSTATINPARRLYERLGFVLTKETEFRIFMRYEAASASKNSQAPLT
jgi:ubiquinone/menaquinone biosynthesis C-methylase UbiE/ribosomal protein S18 acetylase RimI-like enzyme